jgi:hypothetical protein
MTLRVVGAGLPRTGTHSLKVALEQLLDGSCYHMIEIPTHPFDLGQGWQRALAGGAPDWGAMLEGYVASVDWPASMFWRELSDANPDAVVLLSTRESPTIWLESAEATFLPLARRGLDPGWDEGDDLVALMRRFAGTADWSDPAALMQSYERHNAEVRASVPPHRLVDWQARDGWEPICRAIGVRIPHAPFPWTNRREDWG